MREDRIQISRKEIEEVLSPGQNAEGQLRITAPPGKRIRGFVFTDQMRIVTDLKQFTGREIVLRYGIDGTGLADGDEIEGVITLATDAGEYSVPVHARVLLPLPESSQGRIRNLKNFSDLALRNPEEAFRLYKNPAFEKILSGESRECRTLYRGLGNDPVTRRKMEEFLVLTGCKKPVELKLIGSGAEYRDVRDSAQYTATLRRSRWGYISLDLFCEDNFIELPVTHISEEDFVGSVCDVPYIIRTEKLGPGRRTGTIRIRGGREDLTLTVTASGSGSSDAEREIRIQHHVRNVMRLLLEDRVEQLDRAADSRPKGAGPGLLRAARRSKSKVLLDRILPEISEIRNLGGDRLYLSLLESWLRIRAGQQKEAIGLLYPLRSYDMQADPPEARGLYLYLCTEAGLLPDEMRHRGEKIREWALRRPESFLLMKLTCLTDPEMGRTPIAALKLMKRTFEAGCSSPFLYAEALELLLKDESLLSSLDRFSRQVLAFAVKQGHFTEELAARTAYLSDNEKRYRPVMFQILSGMYRKYPLSAVLEAVCRLLIKGPSRQSRCFSWYALALDANLRITRLYEYYIETIPESWQKILPAAIRKYFMYNDTLSGQNRAWLYANIVRNRMEDPDTFADYREKIAAFADESLRDGRMNADYAAIYQVFFKDVTDNDAAASLADLIFSEQVFCDDRRVRRVIAVHEELKEEERSPLVRGRALIHSYTDETEILFEDAEGNRFRSGEAYSVERLMNPDAYVAACLAKGSRKEGLILYALDKSPEITAENRTLWETMAEGSEFSDAARSAARRKLLHYYFTHKNDYGLKRPVERLNDREYVKDSQALLTEVLLSFGLYERAFHLIMKYGAEHIEDSLLVRLADRMIEEKHSENDADLTALCMTVWKRRKFDEKVLSYLTKYWNGSMEDMLLLRKDAKDFFTETFPLDQRILVRIMFSRLDVPDGPQILRHYIERGGTWRLAREYIAYAAGNAFDKSRKVDPYLGLCLREMYSRESMSFLMKMTLLRFYSEKERLDALEEEQVDSLLKEAEERGLILGFFQHLPKSFVRQYQLEDKVIIETQADPDDKVFLQYHLDAFGTSGKPAPAQKNRDEFRREPLANVYRGIFQKIFTLFYGEELTYTVTTVHDGTESVTPLRKAVNPFADMTGRSRYQRINQMLKSMHDGDTEKLREELLDYRKDAALMENLFSLREDIQ